MQKNAFMKNDKWEKIIPVGGSFCEIEKGRTRLKVSVPWWPELARGKI